MSPAHKPSHTPILGSEPWLGTLTDWLRLAHAACRPLKRESIWWSGSCADHVLWPAGGRAEGQTGEILKRERYEGEDSVYLKGEKIPRVGTGGGRSAQRFAVVQKQMHHLPRQFGEDLWTAG